MQTTEDTTLNTKLSAIDRALAAAKARKAAKAAAATPEEVESTPKAKATTSPEFAKARREAANKELTEARAARKAQRDAERAEKRASKDASQKGPAHMKKVETAGSKLPPLSDSAQLLFSDITTNLSREQVTAIALHLQHFNRLRATERALGQRVSAGIRVRVIGGDPKYVGLEGTVDRAQRIRCYVNVPGFRKPAYLFTSDVEVVAVSEEAVAV